MGSVIEFGPEFYAMVTAFWQTYQPMIMIWLGVVLAMVVIAAFGIAIYSAIRPLLP